MRLTRREFHGAVLAGACGLAAGQAADPAPGAGLGKIAVSTWSYHNYFPNTRYGKPQFDLEEWTIEDVVRKVKDRVGITAFEISSAHLKSFEPEYLDRLRQFVGDQKCQFIHLSDNFRGVNLARADAEKREADIKTFEHLIGVAQRLKIPSMRVNTGTPETKDWDLQTTIDIYRRLAKHAQERGVEIVIENHFGISADPKNVARIIEAVGDNISSCPDFGLLPGGDARWPGLETMLKHCKRVVSAKFHGLDARGEHQAYDLKRCYEMLRAARFAGWASLEYEGPLEPMPQIEKMHGLAREWLKA